jgi:3',5'-cyclic-AMP phosphodiesterase
LGYRIAQLSDLHLTAARGKNAWRSPVWESFERALECLGQEGEFDRIILTGDLANVRKPATYARLREVLAPVLDRTRLIPGNHDSRRLVAETFTDRILAGRGTVNFVDSLPGLRLIGLDSMRPFRVSGKLGDDQRAWLQIVLQESNDPTLLFVHHPVLRVGCWWLDKDILRDASQLADIVRGSCVRAIFFGHVHQVFSGEFAGVPTYATPSTAYQFPPHSIRPMATGRGEPSFRIIEVDGDSSLTTRVVRVGPAVAKRESRE